MNIRPMTDVEKRSAAKTFVETWLGRGDEKQDAQNFWRQLLQTVYGVESPESDVLFEYPIKKDVKSSTIFIDAYIKDTAVLIEQKGKDINLRKHYEQSDGSKLTPYGQARRYAGLLPHNMNPRWIVVSNFQEFHIHDMNNPNGEPYVVLLKDLEKEYTRLNFLVDTGSENLRREMEISKKAGDLVGLLFNAFLKQYKEPSAPRTLHSLNVLCVRLVFCLYAEDAGIFGRHLMFHDYMKAHGLAHARQSLIDLFKVLDQQPEERDPYLDDDLAAFPYVNGGLFEDEDIEIPRLNEEIYQLLLRDASEDFDWSEISPTIFGAMFESTLNPETRRKGGMHYTAIENIHKVIDPLFLDDLKAEYASIMSNNVIASRHDALERFQDKLASLSFLDPAAGSGNFLTESYLCIRRLENQVIRGLLDSRTASTKKERTKITAGQIAMGTEDLLNPIKVSITQFHGIEINDFAVSVARTALWIAESQMMKETENIILMKLHFLPLKTQANIRHDNALRIDWESVVDKSRLSFIMGNPPFVGARQMKEGSDQKKDMLHVFGPKWKNLGNLDYVCAWYKKATDLMQGTEIRSALVSTNSVSQGDAVATLWKPLLADGVHIDFAHRTFRWDSEASIKAHVHCVIIGFSVAPNAKPKQLFDENNITVATNINPYLFDGENILIESRSKPLCDVPDIGIGNQPIDGKNYLFSKEEMDAFIASEQSAAPYFKEWYGADEFINRCPRYCLWLGACSPSELRKMPQCMKRVQAVREYRLASPRGNTRKLADKPTRFQTENMPKSTYVVIPEVSSEKRKYVPMGFMTPDILCSNLVKIMPDATLYHFGILESGAHMAWMRTVCGRLETRYRYSKDIVYNNFPWPSPTDEQRKRIETTAQAILDARELYPDSSLADLYNEVTMPPELRKAHQANDMAVLAAYGIKKGDPAYGSESACVAFLMKRYQELTAK